MNGPNSETVNSLFVLIFVGIEFDFSGAVVREY